MVDLELLMSMVSHMQMKILLSQGILKIFKIHFLVHLGAIMDFVVKVDITIMDIIGLQILIF